MWLGANFHTTMTWSDSMHVLVNMRYLFMQCECIHMCVCFVFVCGCGGTMSSQCVGTQRLHKEIEAM